MLLDKMLENVNLIQYSPIASVFRKVATEMKGDYPKISELQVKNKVYGLQRTYINMKKMPRVSASFSFCDEMRELMKYMKKCPGSSGAADSVSVKPSLAMGNDDDSIDSLPDMLPRDELPIEECDDSRDRTQDSSPATDDVVEMLQSNTGAANKESNPSGDDVLQKICDNLEQVVKIGSTWAQKDIALRERQLKHKEIAFRENLRLREREIAIQEKILSLKGNSNI